MKRIALMISLALLLLGVTGCYKDMVIVDTNYDARSSVPTQEYTRIDLLGLVNFSPDIDLDRVCPNGTGIVRNQTTAFLLLLTVHKTEVFCK